MTRERSPLIKISGDVSLRNAQLLAQTLRDAIAAGSAVCIDTSGITVADLTTAQLLLAARKQAVAAGQAFTLAAAPEGALRDLLMQVGFLTAGQADAAFWTPATTQEKDKAA